MDFWSLHNYVKPVLDFYDHFISGETCLHKAIVSENFGMVKFLIENGADLNVRCYGRFFRPDDQKAWCIDSLDHEPFNLYSNTNYEG